MAKLLIHILDDDKSQSYLGQVSNSLVFHCFDIIKIQIAKYITNFKNQTFLVQNKKILSLHALVLVISSNTESVYRIDDSGWILT